MLAIGAFGFVLPGVIVAYGGLIGALEIILEKAQSAKLEISPIDILLGRKWFLAVIALKEALHLLIPRILLQVRKDHFHLRAPGCLVLRDEG